MILKDHVAMDFLSYGHEVFLSSSCYLSLAQIHDPKL